VKKIDGRLISGVSKVVFMLYLLAPPYHKFKRAFRCGGTVNPQKMRQNSISLLI
jgi:hypothetical protein